MAKKYYFSFNDSITDNPTPLRKFLNVIPAVEEYQISVDGYPRAKGENT